MSYNYPGKYTLVYHGEIIDTAGSRGEAEDLVNLYKSDYGPEIKIVKDAEASYTHEDYGDEYYDELNQSDSTMTILTTNKQHNL